MPAVDVNLNATNENQELRSVSLTVELTEVQDSILLHLTNLLESVVSTCHICSLVPMQARNFSSCTKESHCFHVTENGAGLGTKLSYMYQLHLYLLSLSDSLNYTVGSKYFLNCWCVKWEFSGSFCASASSPNSRKRCSRTDHIRD